MSYLDLYEMMMMMMMMMLTMMVTIFVINKFSFRNKLMDKSLIIFFDLFYFLYPVKTNLPLHHHPLPPLRPLSTRVICNHLNMPSLSLSLSLRATWSGFISNNISKCLCHRHLSSNNTRVRNNRVVKATISIRHHHRHPIHPILVWTCPRRRCVIRRFKSRRQTCRHRHLAWDR
jgi:hypothetical protein